MSLILDGDKQQSWRANQEREKQLEARQRNLAQDLITNAISVESDGGVDTSSLLAQMGKPMTAEQVIAKLKKISPRFYFILNKQYNLWGIYIHDPQGKVWTDEDTKNVVTVRHICGMENGVMPEFSVLHKKKKLVANPDLLAQDATDPLNPKNKVDREAVQWKEIDTFSHETRGWRTVIVRLLHHGLITEADVNTHFGWMPSRESQKWHDRTEGPK